MKIKISVILLLLFNLYSITANGDDWDNHFKLAKELESIGLAKKALSTYQVIFKNLEAHDRDNVKSLARAAFGEGRCWESLKKHELALIAYMKITYIYKGELEPKALFRIGRLFHTKLKKPVEAKKAYLRLQEQFPQDPMAGDVLFYSADIVEKQKLFKETIELCEKMVTNYPGNKKADIALERIAKIKLKHYDAPLKAIEIYRRIDTEYPNSSVNALWEIGRIYEKKLNDIEKAKAVYLELIENYPKSKEIESAKKRIGKIDKQLKQ